MLARLAVAAVLLSAAAVVRADEAPERMEHFVRVSPRDARYFELDDGRPYVPIGLNMIAPPRGGDIEGLEDWFRTLAVHRGNFVRIWLAHGSISPPRRSGLPM